MIRRLLIALLLLATSAVIADEILEITEAPPGGDFTLQGPEGAVALSDFRGQVVLLYFGNTKCPDVCPTSLAFLAQAYDQLTADELAQVQGMFISVDPARDSVASLQTYVTYFHDSLIGLTGDDAAIAHAAALYGVEYYAVDLEGSAFGYSINHSSATYLVTPSGELRYIFPHATPYSVVANAIKHVLAGR